MSAVQQSVPERNRRSGPPANTPKPIRKITILLNPLAQVGRVEVEVFNALIGDFAKFAANDNQPPEPKETAIRAPPRAV